MNRRCLLKSMGALAFCSSSAAISRAAEGPHWSYEGDTGPDKWGSLGGEGNVCATGTQQSPVDISETARTALPRLVMIWARSADTIVNNGHTIELGFADGGTLGTSPHLYRLKQFHFHRPSEHTIGGWRTAMEVHFVHERVGGDGDNFAVVGVRMIEGRPNRVFARIVATMPTKEGPPVAADPGIDPYGLLPFGGPYIRYAGSLTTPPCSETVAWMVLAEPIEVAPSDIEAFAKLYPDNARPVQKLNRRFLLWSHR
jgi:carbonic anhydrase